MFLFSYNLSLFHNELLYWNKKSLHRYVSNIHFLMLVYLNRIFLLNFLDKKFHQGNHNHHRSWIWRKRIFSNQIFLRISNQWICTCWNIAHDLGRHFSNVSKNHKKLWLTLTYSNTFQIELILITFRVHLSYRQSWFKGQSSLFAHTCSSQWFWIHLIPPGHSVFDWQSL